MEKLIEKIEIYHFINYILPGTIFVAIFNKICINEFIDSNVVIAVVEYYFIGLILSRIGSIILQPIFQKIKLIKYADYNKYIQASEEDNKLEILQREANQYRTYVATFIILFIIQSYTCIVNKKFSIILIFFVGLIALFILAYKKQIKFIVNRVESNQN